MGNLIKVKFDYELEELQKTLTVLSTVNRYWDNYGADADGNRGEMRLECEIDELTIYDGSTDVTRHIEQEFKSDLEKIEEKIIEKAAEYEE